MKFGKKCLLYVLTAAILLSAIPSGALSNRAYAKYILLEENFNSYPTGEKTVANSQFRTAANTGGSFEIVNFPSSANKSIKSTIDNFGISGGSVTNLFIQLGKYEVITLEFSVYPTNMQGNIAVALEQPITRKTSILATIGNSGLVVPAQGDSMAQTYAQPYDTNAWMKLRFVMNTKQGKYDFYYNDKLAAANLDMPLGQDAWAENGITQCFIQRSGSNMNADCYFDDIKVYSGTPDSMQEPPKIEEDNGGTVMWFSPKDKATTLQNPPFFRWTDITLGDSYDLQLSRDENMETVAKEIKDIPVNYYSMPETLEPGIWYWRVRGRSVNGQTEWSRIRRFRISKDAVSFTVPETDDFVKRVRKDHPRIWTNQDDLPRFRSLAEGAAKDFFATIKQRVDEKIEDPIPEEPKFSPPEGSKPGSAEYVAAQKELRSYSDGKVNEMLEAGFVYLVTGDKKYGEKCVGFLESIADWDVYGDTNYNVQDQVHRAIAYKSAIAYDWVYDLLNTAQKEKVRTMVKERTKIMYDLLLRGYPLYKQPFDSHGWSAAGFMGIISIAMMDEIPEAEEWFRNIIPLYINVQPEIGGEDGGYAAGLAYWSYAHTPFASVVFDAVYSATGLQPVERIQSRNEGLFPLYMSPVGQPSGAFGDEANIPSWRDSTCVTFYLSQAHLLKNSAAKWGAQVRGIKPYDGEISYYAHFEDEVPAIPPLDYPSSHVFRDVGFVGMHTDLVDPNRVSFLFKSSPYGSYNHAHADQNSFTINAYGEPLAIDSGWYDYYYSAHDKGYAKRTHAHNAITYDGLNGQYFNPTDSDGNINAKGFIGGFVTGDSFDGVTGDATRAYAGNLGKAVRSAVFLKDTPTIIVVDELKANDGGQKSFAYNLHAREKIETDSGKNQAVIRQGKAEMVATMAYPENLTIESFDKFITADTREEVRPVNASRKDQYFVNFNTEKLDQTVMVSVLDIHKKEEGERDIQIEKNEECMKITVGGQTVYVRLKQEGAVSFDNVTFDGSLCAFGENRFLLQNGTSLIKDGIVLAKTTEISSVLYEEGRLHLSAQQDNKLEMNLGCRIENSQQSGAWKIGLPVTVNSITDRKGFVMEPKDSAAYCADTMPLKWNVSAERLSMEFEAGDYDLYLNGTSVLKPAGLQVRIEGTPVSFENAPVFRNETVMVPAAAFGQSIGAVATEKDGGVILTKGDTAIEITEGASSVSVNGTAMQMNESAQNYDGVLYVPVRPICDGFGARIGWHDAAKTVYIYTSPIYEAEFHSSVWPHE